VQAISGRMDCSFSRQNTINNPKYYNLNNMSTPYFIVAFGSGLYFYSVFVYDYHFKEIKKGQYFLFQGDVGYHFTNRGFSSSRLSLSVTNNATINSTRPIPIQNPIDYIKNLITNFLRALKTYCDMVLTRYYARKV